MLEVIGLIEPETKNKDNPPLRGTGGIFVRGRVSFPHIRH